MAKASSSSAGGRQWEFGLGGEQRPFGPAHASISASESDLTAEGAGRRTRPRPEIRREQVFEQAIRIIGQRGYHGFSVQALAESCGLTNAGLLYHFKSKDQLLTALLEDRDRRDAEVVAAAVEQLPRDSWPLGVFREIVHRNSIQPELVRLYAILQAEALDADHPAHEFFAARDSRILAGFQDILRSHVPDPTLTAHQLLSFMFGLELRWLRASQSFDLVETWDAGARLLLGSPSSSSRIPPLSSSQ